MRIRKRSLQIDPQSFGTEKKNSKKQQIVINVSKIMKVLFLSTLSLIGAGFYFKNTEISQIYKKLHNL